MNVGQLLSVREQALSAFSPQIVSVNTLHASAEHLKFRGRCLCSMSVHKVQLVNEVV